MEIRSEHHWESVSPSWICIPIHNDDLGSVIRSSLEAIPPYVHVTKIIVVVCIIYLTRRKRRNATFAQKCARVRDFFSRDGGNRRNVKERPIGSGQCISVMVASCVPIVSERSPFIPTFMTRGTARQWRRFRKCSVAIRQVFQRLRARAAGIGPSIRFPRYKETPRCRLSHRLIAFICSRASCLPSSPSSRTLSVIGLSSPEFMESSPLLSTLSVLIHSAASEIFADFCTNFANEYLSLSRSRFRLALLLRSNRFVNPSRVISIPTCSVRLS